MLTTILILAALVLAYVAWVALCHPKRLPPLK